MLALVQTVPQHTPALENWSYGRRKLSDMHRETKETESDRLAAIHLAVFARWPAVAHHLLLLLLVISATAGQAAAAAQVGSTGRSMTPARSRGIQLHLKATAC